MSKLSAILARVLDIPEREINDKTGPENVASWDSFNGMLLVTEIEGAFGVEFTMEEVARVKTVKDIKKTLKRYGALQGY